MNHTSGNIDELLIRILDDTATRSDVRVFAEWIRAEENRKYFEQYKKMLVEQQKFEKSNSVMD